MNQTFMKKASFNQQILFFLMGALMMGFSIYLTSHYYEVKFPTSLSGGSLCNINDFFNCDATTLSPLSNIAGIPISVFGILMGVFLMFYFMFKSEEYEGTLYTILGINVVGCVALFLYSLIGLGHLCPFCSLYYLVSIIAFAMLHKIGEVRGIAIKELAIMGVVTLVVSGLVWNHSNGLTTKSSQRNKQIVQMFNNLQNLGTPKTPSSFRLASATEKFEDAPIQLSVFSDFQCPACKALNMVLPSLERKYKGKINIQYFFYPLDHNCNPNMKNALHPLACKAAYMTACAPTKDFHKIHDDIFDNQEGLSDSWINSYAQKLGVTECMAKPETKKLVVDMINQADAYSVRSTPTTLLNGVKIEGVRPLTDYYAIMDSLLEKKK